MEQQAGRLWGITPAWAGKRPALVIRFNRCQDHPRMGGEKYPGNTDPKDRWGSPPHGRGKVRVGEVRPVLRRITPAWAGKS